jgi:hypothetical protein
VTAEAADGLRFRSRTDVVGDFAQAFPAGAEKFFRGRFRDAPRVFNALRRAKSRCVLA